MSARRRNVALGRGTQASPTIIGTRGMSRVKYEVQVVGDDELPQDIKRVIVERPGRGALLLLAESVAGTWAFMRQWEEDNREPADVFVLRPAG